MPKIDGIEVLRRLKEDEELKKIPVIMITTTDDPAKLIFAIDLAATAISPSLSITITLSMPFSSWDFF